MYLMRTRIICFDTRQLLVRVVRDDGSKDQHLCEDLEGGGCDSPGLRLADVP